MAISYVGGVQGGRAGATTTTTQSLSGTLTGGSDTSPSAGDLVVVLCASGADTTAAPSQDISGNNNGAYTGLTAQSSVVATTYDTYSRVSYKIQGSTVDTTITIPSSGSARNAQRWVVHVFRGVDPTTPMDATATYATGTGTGRPNPAAITPTTAGAWICAFYASAAGTGAAYTAPTDFATDWLGGTTADTADCMTGGGYYTGWTSGSYDPAAITAGGTTNAADTWTATTIALRPTNTPPTVALDNPANASSDSDTTPTLYFTGTDTQSDDVRYNVQIDTVNSFTSTVQQSCTGGTVFNSLQGGTSGGSEARGMSFTTGSAYTLTGVALDIGLNNSPTDGVYVEIRSGSITGTVLGTSATVDSSSIASGSGSYDLFTFSGGIALSAATKYYIVLFRTGARSTTDYYVWYGTTSGYADGGGYVKTSDAWGSENATGDLNFYTHSSFLDKVSGTDSGFTGTPDSTDPFASAQQVNYTVQAGDALSPDTYYWRVRGIDPSGSNTYGEWSSTRSFEVTGGTTIVPQDIQHSLTIDATTINQNHVLTVQDISHGLTIDATTISQNHVISPSDIQHGLTIDATTIAVTVPISPADIQHGLTIDTTTITQNHVITPSDIAFGFTTDNGTINQNHVLVTQDIQHGLTVDTTTITQTHVLAPQDVQHGLTIDTTTISQNHVIVPQDISHSITLDNDTITQLHVLSPADIQHSLTIDTTTINQNHILATQDISHSLTLDNTTVAEAANALTVQDVQLGLNVDATTITQNHIFTPDDIAFGFSADGTAIAQNHVVSPADISHGLTIDATAISQNHVISTQDIQHGITLDNTTLTQIHIIQTSDIAFGFTADGTSIGQVHILQPSDLELATQIDTTSLTQVHTLVTQDISHGLTIDNTTLPDPNAARKYYIDTNGNVYWVINQSAGLVELV